MRYLVWVGESLAEKNVTSFRWEFNYCWTIAPTDASVVGDIIIIENNNNILFSINDSLVKLTSAVLSMWKT